MSRDLSTLVAVEPSVEEVFCTKAPLSLLAGTMALEIRSSQSSLIPSLVERELGCLVPSQRFLLFGLEPSPGDQRWIL